MSLRKQIFILIAIVISLAYTGTIYISVKSTQEYLNSQLDVHAQDTATSLGLSLAPIIRQRDLAQANSMVDVIFDRGYFKHISLDTGKDSFQIERQLDDWTAKSPDWFIKLLALDTPVATSEIFIDWNEKAKLSVSVHPGYAYDELWKITRNNVLWLLLITIFIGLLVFYGLRAVLQPLLRTEQQALAIAQKKYIFQDELPRARELHNVVTAMNLMTSKVRENIETQMQQANKYQKLAYHDYLTGLANRRCYLLEVDNFVHHREDFRNAASLIIHLSGLMNANEKYGYEYGDVVLNTVKQSLAAPNFTDNKQLVARIGGSDFALLLKNPHANEAVECAEIILKEYGNLVDSQYPGDLSIGITEFNDDKDIRTILSESDQARRQAQSLGTKKWYLFEQPSAVKSGVKTASEWRNLLVNAIETENFELHIQPIKYFNHQAPEFSEVLLRMNDAGQSIPASVFLPTAQDHGLLDKIDRFVVKRMLEFCANNVGVVYAVNLNIRSLEDNDFVQWLLMALTNAGERGKCLLFEVSECRQLRSAKMQETLKLLAKACAGVAVERFGRGNHDFGYLMNLNLSYIKVSGHYIREIEDDSEHQFYIKTLLQMAHNLELDVIAESVETESVAVMVEKLGFDAIQGYYVGRPQAI